MSSSHRDWHIGCTVWMHPTELHGLRENFIFGKKHADQLHNTLREADIVVSSIFVGVAVAASVTGDDFSDMAGGRLMMCFFEAVILAFSALDAFEDDDAARVDFLLFVVVGVFDDAATKDVSAELLSEDRKCDDVGAALADANESATLGGGSWDDDFGVFDAVDLAERVFFLLGTMAGSAGGAVLRVFAIATILQSGRGSDGVDDLIMSSEHGVLGEGDHGENWRKSVGGRKNCTRSYEKIPTKIIA